MWSVSEDSDAFLFNNVASNQRLSGNPFVWVVKNYVHSII